MSVREGREPSTATPHDPPLVALPEVDDTLEQDDEWCVVEVDGEWKQVRLHDYDALYAVPGLYERVIYEVLECRSPSVIRDLLKTHLDRTGADASGLRVLDLGAGNGIVGQELAELGASHIVGADIIKAAKEALDRDRPGVYQAYHVVDMTSLTSETREELRAHNLNCLVCVAALGFGDIPPRAFAEAFNLVGDDGWVVFNIKDRFLNDKDPSGFSILIDSMMEQGILESLEERKYQHRLSLDRKPLHYVAIIGRKHHDIPEQLIKAAEQ